MSRTPGSRALAWNALLAVGLLLLAAAGIRLLTRPGGPERIVLIVVDTLRRDHLSVHGGPVETPNVAALAARGLVFENLVASFHQTSMSMAALFTGRTPSIEAGAAGETLAWNGATWCGMARFAESPARRRCIPPSLPTLAEALRDAGYWTIGVVSNPFLYEPSGFSRGFEEWLEVGPPPPPGPLPPAKLAERGRARNWRAVQRGVELALERRPQDRLFLYAHYLDVHDYRILKRSYAEAVVAMDAALGELLASLERRGLLEGAVVVLTSDHGERLGEAHGLPGELPRNFGHYGNPSFEEMLRVPLIVAPPVLEGTARFLRTQDLYALIQEIAGLDPPAAADTRPDELFVSELKFRTYRRGRWKASVHRGSGRSYLYDLEADPDERRDLSREEPVVLQRQRERIEQLSRALAAPTAVRALLSEADRERLRSLGYLEEPGQPPGKAPGGR